MPSNILKRACAVSIGRWILIAALTSGFNVAHAQDANAVVIKNFMFEPMSLTVKAGSTVTWKNLDGEPHTVVNDAGVFHSAALDENDTYQYKFDKPGVYKVFCGIHPNMKATITVQ
ncbi:cupredoxin family copper-binding protein [Burkholderia sp. Ac-20365]|uniref:cupredoxin domain-containing protein n=1 Tax=Burkholderia sp. Ac-20365 TaxID=2703897 RepID=UPI00197C5980|nr:cupredoxin family copper-binding protein [Burkholderia sp. Ac-20365]MBN3761830.1 cupredoxin family copper-binding protein [Burkholderia sp. Ac-20365]